MGRWTPVLAGVALALSACKRSSSAPKPAVSAALSASAAPRAAAPARVPTAAIPRLPVGPRLAIESGAGVGPIRIGATRQTIERLMGAPCEDATETLCRYVERALEFRLKDGKTDQIRIHQQERLAGGQDPSGAPRRFGVFNGFIPPGAAFGMLPAAVQEIIGPPKRVEPAPEPNPNNTKQHHYYDGMVLEYDLYPNGNLILGGVRIPG
jgi:hypothetical protein